MTLAGVWPGAIAGTKQKAAERDVVILAPNWVKVPEALKDIDWRGRILIDATNAHVDPKSDISLAGVTRSRAALKGRTSSEMVAEMAVGARLVESISNMPMAWIQDFSPDKPRTVIFTSGDDAEAKQLVIELINSAEFVIFSPDGQFVAYVTFPEGILWRANWDGSHPVQLTDAPLYPLGPRWSPDGAHLVRLRQIEGFNVRLLSAQISGGPVDFDHVAVRVVEIEGEGLAVIEYELDRDILLHNARVKGSEPRK